MSLNYFFSSKLKHGEEYANNDISIFRSLYHIDADPFLVDRTGSVRFPFSENNYFPMIKPLPEVISWEECTKQRVEELISFDKELSWRQRQMVFYSRCLTLRLQSIFVEMMTVSKIPPMEYSTPGSSSLKSTKTWHPGLMAIKLRDQECNKHSILELKFWG